MPELFFPKNGSFEEVVKQKNIEIKKDFLGSDFNIVSDEKRVGQIIKNFLSKEGNDFG